MYFLLYFFALDFNLNASLSSVEFMLCYRFVERHYFFNLIMFSSLSNLLFKNGLPLLIE
jgi:hypothetical protein